MASQNSKKSIWAKLAGKKNGKIQPDEYERPLALEENRKENLEVTSDSLKEEKSSAPEDLKTNDKEEWIEDKNYEGQLSVDVYQTKNHVVIKSTIAGVKPENLDISIVNDMITIQGSRQKNTNIKKEDYFYQECYWGEFSRSIILPVEIQTNKIEATLEDGILTVTLPKLKKSKTITVRVKRGRTTNTNHKS